jgi:SAM-dependent methyltransferase
MDEPLYARRYVRRRHCALARYHHWMAHDRARMIQRHAPIGPADRVLEIGCDTGALLRALSASGATLCGVDVNADALPACAPFDVRVGSAEALPFTDEEFECVVASHVIEHVGDAERMLAEAARVLRPGGALVLWYPFELFRGMTVVPELIADGRPLALARRYHRRRCQPRTLRAPARRVALDEVLWRWCIYGPIPEYLSIYRKRCGPRSKSR